MPPFEPDSVVNPEQYIRTDDGVLDLYGERIAEVHEQPGEDAGASLYVTFPKKMVEYKDGTTGPVLLLVWVAPATPAYEDFGPTGEDFEAVESDGPERGASDRHLETVVLPPADALEQIQLTMARYPETVLTHLHSEFRSFARKLAREYGSDRVDVPLSVGGAS